MKKSTIILGLAVLTFLGACSSYPSRQQETSQPQVQEVEPTEVMSDTSENSLDWAGTYQGMIPCADCEGIEVSLTLNEDMSYMMTSQYVGKSEEIIEQTGTFMWNTEGNTVVLSDIENAPNQYLVGENILIQLDLDGNRITGDLSDNYILNKVADEASLLDVRWKLTELMGQPLTHSDTENQVVYMTLITEDNKVQGFGGCNNFLGSYKFQEGDRLTFSQIVSTQRACENMALETELFKVLETADNYHWDGDVLMLHKAKMSPLAKFEAMN
jgi:uncharacterized lipoprotein NlpE involved in copper resistance